MDAPQASGQEGERGWPSLPSGAMVWVQGPYLLLKLCPAGPSRQEYRVLSALASRATAHALQDRNTAGPISQLPSSFSPGGDSMDNQGS